MPPMALLSWCSARCGGISLFVLSTLCSYVLWDSFSCREEPSHKVSRTSTPVSHASGEPSIWHFVFALYSLSVHCCVVVFQLRACWAILESTNGLRKFAQKVAQTKSTPLQSWIQSSKLPSNSDTLSPRSSRSSIDGWNSGTEIEDDLELVTHAILIPNYKESVEVLIETLDILASHLQARYAYDVCTPSILGTERLRTYLQLRYILPWKPVKLGLQLKLLRC